MMDHPEAARAFRENPAIVFVNSAAGRGRARVYLPRIQEVFKSLRIQAQFVMTNSSSELESCAQAAISQGKQLLLAMGGDGTFQSLANAASGADVVLGILPIGGGNDFASALGLPSEPTEAAEAMLCGEPRKVDLLRVRTADGQSRLYAGGGGIGLTRRRRATPVVVTAICLADSAILQRRSTLLLDISLWTSASIFRKAVSLPLT